MKDYRNMFCAACGKPFDADSDIVVCPECGAPHHRDCWKSAGQCACADKHSDNYEWNPPAIVISNTSSTAFQPVVDDSGKESVVCPVCGRETSKSEKYCEHCGYYLAHDRDGAYSESEVDDDFEGFYQFDKSELIEGVPAGDVKRFVGGMWIYYIPRFIKMSRYQGSFTFNFTAFLMHGLWFISRKMYSFGIFLTLIMAGISCYQIYFRSVSANLTGERLLFFASIYIMLSGIEFLVMILSGIFGNKIYMTFCARRIKKINAEATARHSTAKQFNEAIEESGGIASVQTISVTLCYMAVMYMFGAGFFL